MALKAFQREGLRRDKNLADLPSPNTALNNILGTPSMLGSNESFTVDDLAPIKNIYITNITSSTFATLNGVTLSFTVVLPGPPPEIDNTSNPIVYRPLVKIKNRLDTAYFSTGEPFFYGGDGPNATYYDANDIIRETTSLTFDQIYGTDIEPAMQIIQSGNNLYRTSEGAIRSTASGQLTHTYGTVDGFTWVKEYSQWDVYLNPVLNELTAEDESIRDQFWERGQFVYGSKVQTSFVSLFGGVNWQGLFKPIESGDSRFFLRTTGCTQFKFQHPLYPPYSAFRYGKVDVAWEQNNGTFTAGGTYLTNLQAWLSDPTRRWIKVVCEDNVQLQTEDVIFLDTVEGPLQPRQYTIYGLTDKDPSATPQDPTTVAGKTIFFVEATTDFNLNNVDYGAIPTKSDPNQTTTGYKGTARYFPYERRPYKSYLNSVRHKITIPLSDYTPIGNDGALESYLQINDENIYRSIMIEDYIYDYRRRVGDEVEDEANPGTFVPVHTVRRYKITACNDTTQQITLELDSTYAEVQAGSNNDQYGYVDQLSKLLKYSGTSAERIREVKNTGYINDTIDTGNDLFAQGTPNSPTDTLYYVARFGSATPRYKYINIDQFLEGYTDYAIDWVYFSKDEDMDGASQQKAWVLWYRSETGADYGPLDFKYLYDKNYKFYEIGDFKRFLDNSVLGFGTSREDGIDQRAFGKPKLINKGDQYNMMFSLLPVKSEYDPPVNWNEVAKSITGTIPEGSRAVDISDASIVEEGNYIIDNSSAAAWTQGTNEFGYRSRINTKLWGTNTIITSIKATASVENRNIYSLDHKGFITTLEITGGSGNSYNFTGDASEVKIGHVIVSPEFPSQSAYVRIVKVDYNSGSNNGTFVLDTSVNFNGNNKLVAVYYDRGIDITKPLAAFCTDSGCGQHAYSGEKTNTEFIAIKATSASGANSALDAIIASYTGTSNVQTINNGSASTTWLLESNMGDVTQSNYNNNIWNNSVVTVQWDAGLNAEDNADGEGLTSMSNTTYYPMGWLKGLVRLKGKIWEGTAGNNEYEYYWIVRLGSNWQSNAAGDKFAVPPDSEGNSNGLNRNGSFNPRSFSSSAWNIQSYRLQIGSGGPGNYPQDGNISSSQDLDNAHAQANSGLGGWKTVGVDINLTGAQQGYFENLDTIAPDSPSTTYVLKAGMYIRRMVSDGPFWIFKDFNDFQDVHTVWANTDGSFNPSGSGNTGTSGSGRTQQLVYLEPQQGPVKVLGNGINDNFRYLHYRRKQYEVVPVNAAVENATAGHMRLVNFGVTTSSLVDNILQNNTNKLSVFTFANTTDNRELCCPPLDTSPPFDSSPIGLSTTSTEPDMNIGGLVNVRSINGNHPSTKMKPISLENLANIGTCPVNKKFQIMFGGIKYDLLLANQPTQGGGSTLDKIINPDLYP